MAAVIAVAALRLLRLWRTWFVACIVVVAIGVCIDWQVVVAGGVYLMMILMVVLAWRGPAWYRGDE